MSKTVEEQVLEAKAAFLQKNLKQLVEVLEPTNSVLGGMKDHVSFKIDTKSGGKHDAYFIFRCFDDGTKAKLNTDTSKVEISATTSKADLGVVKCGDETLCMIHIKPPLQHFNILSPDYYYKEGSAHFSEVPAEISGVTHQGFDS